MSVKETAAKLGVPARTLYDYCRQKKLPHIRVVRKVLFLRETVDRMIAEGFFPGTGPHIDTPDTIDPVSPGVDPDQW